MTLTRRSRASAFGLISTLVLAGCDGGGGDEPSETTDATDTTDTTDTTETGGALSYAADIQPIWDANCVTACHVAGGNAAAVLDLSGNAYAAIVDVGSGQALGKKLVAPGSSTDSYLIAKLEGNQVAAGGSGGTMPSGADMLSAETIQLVADWIDAGAPE
ncbi:hypothetical protein ACNOYE_18465 [Nannocystaceae bacterium ST9]